MSFKSGCKSFINCCKTASEGLMEYSGNDRIKYVENATKYFGQSFFYDGPFMFFNDLFYSLDSKIFKHKKYLIQEEVKEKIVILIPGFTSNIGAMPNLINAINNAGYTCFPVKARLLFHNVEKVQVKIIKDVLRILKENKNKQAVLFGYSYGGAIAHSIGVKRRIPQVTYGAPLENENIPISVGFHYYGKTIVPPMGSNKYSTDIVEEFSPENPFPYGRIVAKGVLSHFSPNRKVVVDLIIKSIDEAFENMDKNNSEKLKKVSNSSNTSLEGIWEGAMKYTPSQDAQDKK